MTLTAGAIAAPNLLFAENEVPALLDHILLGSNDLQRGIEFVADQTGGHAAFGGVHPGRGTQNALLSLGERCYLEIIAPDPGQPDVKNPMTLALLALDSPKLVGWADHPGDILALAEKLRASGIRFHGPTPGWRKRPDGRILQWQTLNLVDDTAGLLPFFIEWASDLVHPSADAPKGCSLTHFSAETPAPKKLAATVKLLNLDLPVKKGDKPCLLATIHGSKGTLELSS